MNAFYNSLRLFGGIVCKSSSVKAVKGWMQNGRMCTTEVKALRPIKFRTIRRSRRPSPYDVGSFVLMVIPVSSFGLGVWQIFRKFEKDKINDQLMEKTKQSTVDLPQKFNGPITTQFLRLHPFLNCDWSDGPVVHLDVFLSLGALKDMELCSVRVKGKFDHSKEIYLGPRPLIDEDSLLKPASLLSNAKAGYLVITPFHLSDRNLTILVNRGWVPSVKKSPETRSDGQISEEVEVVGLIRNHEIRKPFMSKNVPEKGVWVYRDLYKMAEVTGADPVYIEAIAESSVPGGPIGGQSLVEFKNDHLSYLITWFSLSAVSGYMWYLRHLVKLKGR